MSIDTPVWLLVAGLALPMGWIAWRSFTSMSGWRRGTAAAARAVLLVLLALALAGASTVRETRRVCVVAVVDRSDSARAFADPELRDRYPGFGSVDELLASYLKSAGQERGPDDTVAVVTFDGAPMAIASASRSGSVLDRELTRAGREGTDLESAIRRAASMVPPDASGRIVVLSDGVQTEGDAVAAARELVRSEGDKTGLRIDAIELGYEVRDEVIVESVDAPSRAPTDSTVTVRVLFRSAGHAGGTLQLLADSEPIDLNGDEPGTGRRVSLTAGRNVELIDVPLSHKRMHRFEAIFEPDTDASGGLVGDTYVANNRASSFTLTPASGTVLLVDGVSGGTEGSAGTALARLLGQQRVTVTPISPGMLPRDLLELEQYDLVVLQNVAADEIPDETQAHLEAYVRDLGGGLVMTGGPKSFGAGGWRGSRLEPVLPVALDLPEKLVIPDAAIVLILDSSGSMNHSVLGSARTQQDVANEAAARALRSLEERDLVGVIEFASDATVVQGLAPNTDPDATARKIRGIVSGGGTNIGPALELAYEDLRGADAKVKHAIVLTDGRSENAEALPELARKMIGEGIHVSTIGVGDNADAENLQQIAAAGEGTFYNVVNPNILPNVFLKAVRVLRSSQTRSIPFSVVVPETGSPLTSGIGPLPELGGLNITRVRSEPTITNDMLSPKGEPVLAHWSVGLGQVGAFTSDAYEWGSPWISNPEGARFWTQLVRSLSRTRDNEGGELRAEILGGVMRLSYEGWDDEGRPMDLLTIPVTVYGPDGTPRTITLRQSGPGAYTGDLRVADTGNYIAVATPRLGGARMSPVLAGATVTGGIEFRTLRSDSQLLRELVDAGGGAMFDLNDPKAAQLFSRDEIAPRRTMTPLWPVLLAWAVGVFLLDVGTRRIAWDRFFGAEFGARWRELGAEVATRSNETAVRLAGIKARQPEQDVAHKPLTEVDAMKLASQQKVARQASDDARLAEIRAELLGKKQPLSPEAPSQSVKQPKSQTPGLDQPENARPDEGGSGSGASGLLAAKRRARERFDGEA